MTSGDLILPQVYSLSFTLPPMVMGDEALPPTVYNGEGVVTVKLALQGVSNASPARAAVAGDVFYYD